MYELISPRIDLWNIIRILLGVLHEFMLFFLPHFPDGEFLTRKKLKFDYLENTKENTADIHVKRWVVLEWVQPNTYFRKSLGGIISWLKKSLNNFFFWRNLTFMASFRRLFLTLVKDYEKMWVSFSVILLLWFFFSFKKNCSMCKFIIASYAGTITLSTH